MCGASGTRTLNRTGAQELDQVYQHLSCVQNGASFLGNITSILQSQQAEVASLLQGPTPVPTPQPGLPLPNIGRRLQQVQV